MSGQHCESYDVKRETVPCYPVIHCWPLLHLMAGISARFSNFAFVLFCYITNHLMTGPLGIQQWILFPSNLNVSLDFVLGNIKILEKQNSLFPLGPVVKCLLLSPCRRLPASAPLTVCRAGTTLRSAFRRAFSYQRTGFIFGRKRKK